MNVFIMDFIHHSHAFNESETLLARPQAAADACAAGECCQIGGFIHHASGQSLWFSEKFSHADFAALPLKLDQQMQRSISALKALAQIALIHSVSNFSPGSRMPICLKSLSDNSGAESVSNKCFTTTNLSGFSWKN